jgi:hypothetical protein
MADYDTWDDERETLLNALGDEDRRAVQPLLDAAGASADQGRLADSARRLEEIRRLLVEHGLFGSRDNGILVFSSLIRILRHRSSEKVVPAEYQRCLDAVPNLSYSVPMSPAQRAFWYGSAGAETGGQVVQVQGPPPTRGCALWILVLAGLLALPLLGLA